MTAPRKKRHGRNVDIIRAARGRFNYQTLGLSIGARGSFVFLARRGELRIARPGTIGCKGKPALWKHTNK